MDMRNEITKLIQNGYINQEISEVSKLNWESIIRVIEDNFVSKKSHKDSMHWAWERLKKESYSVQISNEFDSLVSVLERLLQNNDRYWFIVDEPGNKNKQWVYDASLKSIITVLKECSFFEYYIVPKDYSWLLVENHHNCLIGTGLIICEMKKLTQ